MDLRPPASLNDIPTREKFTIRLAQQPTIMYEP
jgi:hypothetical protein